MTHVTEPPPPPAGEQPDARPCRRCQRCKHDLPLSQYRRPDALKCAACNDFVYMWRAERKRTDPSYHQRVMANLKRGTRRKHARIAAVAARNGQPWATEEVTACLDPAISGVDLALKFGRTLGAVYARRNSLRWRLGLSQPIRAAAVPAAKHTPDALARRGVTRHRPKPPRECRVCGVLLTPEADAGSHFGLICKSCLKGHRRVKRSGSAAGEVGA